MLLAIACPFVCHSAAKRRNLLLGKPKKLKHAVTQKPVKPQSPRSQIKSTTSTWRSSFPQTAILKADQKSPSQSRGFSHLRKEKGASHP
jgi:hypothetical protein